MWNANPQTCGSLVQWNKTQNMCPEACLKLKLSDSKTFKSGTLISIGGWLSTMLTSLSQLRWKCHLKLLITFILMFSRLKSARVIKQNQMKKRCDLICHSFSTKKIQVFGSCLYSSSGGNQPELTSCKQVLDVSGDDVMMWCGVIFWWWCDQN